MKEKIYTIPINDAFDKNGECPICDFLQKEEEDRVEYALGASMMEPDWRIISNEGGYCNRHCQMMYDFGNKLSHALVLETRLDYIINSLDKASKNISAQSPKKISIGKSKLKDEVKFNGEFYYKQRENCVICKRLSDVLQSFVENLFFLYKTDAEFKSKFWNSKGFCIEHFGYLLEQCTQNLNDNDCAEFSQKLIEFEKENLKRIKEDVNWFTKKFDYRYKDADWKNSKDAVKRGCLKTSSYINEDE